MPALPNPRHERFAQELAKGNTADEAYQLAGYKPNRGNAATLKANQSVRDRVDEILGKAAQRAEITVATITGKLLAIAQRAEAKTEASMLGVARATYMDVAKLNGLIVERHDLNLNSLTDDQLAALALALGAPAVPGQGAGGDRAAPTAH